ncbi:MAG: LarC family nickel insertion protein [Eubacterium sp.]|nr:LarC family nickel insertion protein [Eubacterium sp.]
MSKSLFIECNTGISGDMSVAALLDLGADRDVLNKMLESLKTVVGGFDVKITRVAKAGIGAADFDVILDNDNHDHDMDYLYGHDHNEHGHHHEHHHDHDEHHHHNHDEHHHHDHDEHHHHDHDEHHHHDHDGHHHHEHHHEHRSYLDVKAIIDKTEMTEGARNLAKKIFGIVAEAEAAVHDRPIDEVHFHEVGAVDSIVDILSAAVCFEDIITKNDIKKCIITRLVDGCGTVRCQHGVIPVPVPAVMKIAEQTGVRLAITERRGEFVTPTGAAFAAAVKTDDRLPESFSVLRVGIGAGKRDYEIPGMVRAMIIEA